MNKAMGLAAALMLGFGGAARADVAPELRERRSLAQVAILLDTSGSMDGLLEQARTQLWRIVNELASSKKNGRPPKVQVALYEYGNDGLPASGNFLRQILPLTANLDKVSQELFALRTNGGSEYTGAVIRDAVDRLAWSRDPGVYKAVFIAGNEPFTQGPVPYRDAVAAAAAKGIRVNTIFCGSRQDGETSEWLAGARSGGGEFLNIDQSAPVVVAAAPQDAEIARLSGELSGTFVPMGSRGRAAARLQAEQDSNALRFASAGAAAERAAFKAAPQYREAAEEWDAVSQIAGGKVQASELKAESLPEPLRKMDAKEREAHLQALAVKRKDIESRIRTLQAARDKLLRDREIAEASQGSSTLGTAVREAVRRQASRAGYSFAR